MPLKSSTLLVLGAGASVAARRYPVRGSIEEVFPKMPSSRNFFYDLFRGGKRPDGSRVPDLNMLGLMHPGLEETIRRAWGLSLEPGYFPEEWHGINVEDVLSFIDAGARMHSRGSDYYKAFRLAREMLIEFIVLMLLTRSQGQHCELLSQLVYGLRPTDSIISFNYDTIADFTLQHARTRQYTNYARLMSGEMPRPSAYSQKGLLLKLHGSINWQLCRDRNCTMRSHPRIAFRGKTRRLPERIGDILGKCPACGHERPKAAIIPPLSEKNLSRQNFFHLLWLIAREQLPRFHRIIFIGYSFPPNDSYTEWLFRQLRFLDQKPPRIIVANPEAIRRRHIVRQRYESLFRGFDIEYHRDFAALVDARPLAT